MPKEEIEKEANTEIVFVVVGEGGTHETLVPTPDVDTTEPGYAFEVFVKASSLDEAVLRADDQLAEEGWQDIEWLRGGEVEQSTVEGDTAELYERAIGGETAVILYALSREDDDNEA